MNYELGELFSSELSWVNYRTQHTAPISAALSNPAFCWYQKSRFGIASIPRMPFVVLPPQPSPTAIPMPSHRRAMPCRAMPCRAVPCRAMLCETMPCRVVSCHAMLCRAMQPSAAVPSHVAPTHVMSCRAVMCSACGVVLCRAAPRHNALHRIASQRTQHSSGGTQWWALHAAVRVHQLGQYY